MKGEQEDDRGSSGRYNDPYGPRDRRKLPQQPQGPPSGDEDAGPPGFPDIAGLAALNKAIHEAAKQPERFKLDHRAPLFSVLEQARDAYEPTDSGAIQTAAILAHGIAQAQAFRDGNRRTAYWTAHFFLKENGLGHLMPSSDHMVARYLNQVVENPQRGKPTPTPDDFVKLFSRRLERRKSPKNI